MAKLVMERKASDNVYLHRDFHVSAEQGIRYIGEKMGDNAVTEYLTNFTKHYYKPLIERVKECGLGALKEHLEAVYRAEEAADALEIQLSDEVLDVFVSYCPGVRYMKSIGHIPCIWYEQTTRTVYQVLADETDLGFHLDFYDPETGKTHYTFFRRCL